MDVQTTEGRASGKVILFGEHAVVYGVGAIAAGISRGVRARARLAQQDSISIGGESIEEGHQLYEALKNLRIELALKTVHLELELEIPAGAGLGASAAMGMAAARALSALRSSPLPGKTGEEEKLSEKRLFLATQAWERVFHGNPSGVDVAAAQRPGALLFTRGHEPEPLLLQQALHLAICQAGPPASTKQMVNMVARFKARNPAQFDRTLQGIAALVDNANLLLRSGDLQAVGKLLDLNHMLLASWMLSTEEIEKACRLAREAGALGAKLTGAGGGGCVVALAEPTRISGNESDPAEPILKKWREAGLECFSARVAQAPVEFFENQKDSKA